MKESKQTIWKCPYLIKKILEKGLKKMKKFEVPEGTNFKIERLSEDPIELKEILKDHFNQDSNVQDAYLSVVYNKDAKTHSLVLAVIFDKDIHKPEVLNFKVPWSMDFIIIKEGTTDKFECFLMQNGDHFYGKGVPRNSNDMLVDLKADNDIKQNTQVYKDIDAMLSEYDFEIAYWNFTTRKNSTAGRETESGSNETCPSLEIVFQSTSDLISEKIDARDGNWNNEWKRTKSIRNKLNKILEEHNLDDEYISPNTFIFVSDSWEEIVFGCLVREYKGSINRVVSKVLTSKTTDYDEHIRMIPKYTFCNSDNEYTFVFEDKKGMNNALQYRKELQTLVETILSSADPQGKRVNYQVEMSFLHLKMKDLNLYGLARED